MRPLRIYAPRKGRLIRLEFVTETSPRGKGAAEPRNEDGFHPVVTAHRTDLPGGMINGKGIRRRSVPNRHPTSGEPNPLNRTAQDKPHAPLERLEPDSGKTVTPSGEKSSVSDGKPPDNTGKRAAKRTEKQKRPAQTPAETGGGAVVRIHPPVRARSSSAEC